ncbi:hypothetical protein ACQKWADRAFT_327280 [Trichoderma austrokoningii]
MMLLILLITTLVNIVQVCEGKATYQEEYRGNYVPNFINTEFGSQIVAPDTPYVAASGQNNLYFIDTHHDAETAQHIKNQIERAMVANADEYVSINETAATAEVKNSKGETVFVFDPPYARVIFAEGMNKHNPSLQLPVHEPSGDWEATYDLGSPLTKRSDHCATYGCHSSEDCIRQSRGSCSTCHSFRVDNECARGLTDAVGACHKHCKKAVDTPRQAGETDASYYQRMDKLHWSS